MTQEESEKKWFSTICYETNWDDAESKIWTIFDINEIRKRDWYQEEFIKASKNSRATGLLGFCANIEPKSLRLFEIEYVIQTLFSEGTDYAIEGALNAVECWDEPFLLPLVEDKKLSDVYLDNYLNECKDSVEWIISICLTYFAEQIKN